MNKQEFREAVEEIIGEVLDDTDSGEGPGDAAERIANLAEAVFAELATAVGVVEVRGEIGTIKLPSDRSKSINVPISVLNTDENRVAIVKMGGEAVRIQDVQTHMAFEEAKEGADVDPESVQSDMEELGADSDGDTKIVISHNGKSVETTPENLKKASKAVAKRVKQMADTGATV